MRKTNNENIHFLSISTIISNKILVKLIKIAILSYNVASHRDTSKIWF